MSKDFVITCIRKHPHNTREVAGSGVHRRSAVKPRKRLLRVPSQITRLRSAEVAAHAEIWKQDLACIGLANAGCKSSSRNVQTHAVLSGSRSGQPWRQNRTSRCDIPKSSVILNAKHIVEPDRCHHNQSLFNQFPIMP